MTDKTDTEIYYGIFPYERSSNFDLSFSLEMKRFRQQVSRLGETAESVFSWLDEHVPVTNQHLMRSEELDVVKRTVPVPNRSLNQRSQRPRLIIEISPPPTGGRSAELFSPHTVEHR